MAKTKRKVVVAYRVVPNEPDQAIVVTTENLMAEEHDTLIKLVESDAGQNAHELAEAMARTPLPDGRNMLAGFHTTGKMVKVAQSEVEMQPDVNTTILLSDLNKAIAEQKGVTVADLAIAGSSASETTEEVEEGVEVVSEQPLTNSEVLDDEALAAKYRSDADRLFKEAKRLREQAEELSPTKRKTKTAESA
jgi:hypothetical protein